MAIAPIPGIASFPSLEAPQPVAPPREATPAQGSFGTMLENAVTSVNTAQLDARDSVAALASGESVDLHGTMIRLEKAEIALRAMTSVRDRMIAAYEQVMNMAL